MNKIKNKVTNLFASDTLESMEMERENRVVKSHLVYVSAVLFFMFVDWFVFYKRFDSILTESFLVNLLMAVVFAVTIDFSPVVLTNRLMVVNKTQSDKFIIKVSGAFFVAMIIISIGLGILGAVNLVGSEGAVAMTGSAVAQTQKDVTLSTYAVSIFQGCIPVATSFVIICMTFEDAKRNRMNILKIQEIRLKREIGNLKAELAYLENGFAMEDLSALDNERFEIMTEILDDVRLLCLITSRRVLAMKLGDSSAAILLQQENTIRNAIESKINGDLSISLPDSDKVSTVSARGQTMLS